MRDYLYSDFELHEQPNGSVHIHSSEPYGEVAVIKPADRPKVSLALLGGITDELVERAAIGAAKARMENTDMTRSWGDDRRFEARCVINAIFGISEH